METFSSFWSNLSKHFPQKARIAFTDSTDVRILRAFHQISDIPHITGFLVGNSEQINQVARAHGLPPVSANSILTINETQQSNDITRKFLEKGQKSGVAPHTLIKLLNESLYQGICFLLNDSIDGLVSGATQPTADVVRAAIKFVGSRPHSKFIAGHFLIESETQRTADKTPYLFADCAVVPEPSPITLAHIALGAAESFRFFTGSEPKVALLSFSTRGSAEHALVDRIRKALKIIQEHDPALAVDGEIQLDAAIDAKSAEIKGVGVSSVAPKANVFIFPTLESGNIGYKLVQRFSRARVAGPLLWGCAKPISDLSRGCCEQDIIDTTMCLAKMAVGLK